MPLLCHQSLPHCLLLIASSPLASSFHHTYILYITPYIMPSIYIHLHMLPCFSHNSLEQNSPENCLYMPSLLHFHSLFPTFKGYLPSPLHKGSSGQGLWGPFLWQILWPVPSLTPTLDFLTFFFLSSGIIAFFWSLWPISNLQHVDFSFLKHLFH